MPDCLSPGCGRPSKTKGFCQRHYIRMWRGGDPFGPDRPEIPMCAKPCSVAGCDQQGRKSGMCSRHFMRFKKHGDPLAGGTSHGDGERWLHAHVEYDGNACLTWPFGGSGFGYGSVTVAGKKVNAHRAMCIMAHGEPSGSATDAAHSCGNGHLGCVHPKHLRWATTTENVADMVAHGTAVRGEKVKTAKLTEDDIRRIRALGGTMRQKEIAAMFGVQANAVSRILSGKRWKWL